MPIEELRTLFLIAYLAFVLWTLVKWARHRTLPNSPMRDRAGSVGLIAGSISVGLFAWFYIYLWIEREPPVRGLDLWALMFVGEGLAIAGFIVGALGLRWVRLSTLFICLVMMFQWLRELVGRVHQARLVDGAMFASLALFGCALLGYKCLTRDVRQA
jgi:hypothetical protein